MGQKHWTNSSSFHSSIINTYIISTRSMNFRHTCDDRDIARFSSVFLTPLRASTFNGFHFSIMELINQAHAPGSACLAFSRDGVCVASKFSPCVGWRLIRSTLYTGGYDCLVRIWKSGGGTDQEPSVAMESNGSITCIATTVSSDKPSLDWPNLSAACTERWLVFWKWRLRS
jgi:hypothetical protein